MHDCRGNVAETNKKKMTRLIKANNIYYLQYVFTLKQSCQKSTKQRCIAVLAIELQRYMYIE